MLGIYFPMWVEAVLAVLGILALLAVIGLIIKVVTADDWVWIEIQLLLATMAVAIAASFGLVVWKLSNGVSEQDFWTLFCTSAGLAAACFGSFIVIFVWILLGFFGEEAKRAERKAMEDF